MEMLQLRVFSLLSQYENMSTVAQILNTSQPQISKLLASLEAELGVQRVIRACDHVAQRHLFAGYKFLYDSFFLIEFDQVAHHPSEKRRSSLRTNRIGSSHGSCVALTKFCGWH